MQQTSRTLAEARAPATARPAARTLGPAGRGFTVIEILIGLVVFALAAVLGSAFIVRSASSIRSSQDEIFAKEKAMAILAEVQALARSDEVERASDLDMLDDEGARVSTLTITTHLVEDELLPVLVDPDHPISGNLKDHGTWRWSRSITIVPFATEDSQDRRLVTVRVYRHHVHDPDADGYVAGEASGVIQSMEDVHVAKQVLDLYVIAIENVPGFWASADTLRMTVTNAIRDVQQRNPGLRLRVHWITKMGFGRDEEYSPHGNATLRTTDEIPLAYYYPGRLPDGEVHRLIYSVATMEARRNMDVTKDVPSMLGDPEAPEIWYDANGNGNLDGGEEYEDDNGNDKWDPGNLYPYALADMHNHAMRYPDALAKFTARVAAGNETEDTPTWRLLLDRMVSEPGRYKNALFLNTHGSVLPMPPVRNYSDPASSPNEREGWRVVTHPERLVPLRVDGSVAASVAPRFRVYAFKTAFDTDEQAMTLPEPYLDKDGSGDYSKGDDYEDLNDNKRYDAGLPITLAIPGGDMVTGANVDGVDSLIIKCLGGGVDADMDGDAEPYDTAWRRAPRLPEPFVDLNGNGVCEVAEPYFDIDGNGTYDGFEPFVDIDKNGVCSPVSEPHQDMLANGLYDRAAPAETYEDKNDNGRWDDAEPYWDFNGNGKWDKPKKTREPQDPWDPDDYGSNGKTKDYIKDNGEPYMDLNGNGKWDEDPEPFDDLNGNGTWDSGFAPGAMFFTVTYDADARRNVISLYGTPLETPTDSTERGLDPQWRLYDYDYVPCPTPATPDAADRFGRDLSVPGDGFAKNTARWTLEMPVATMRTAYETAPGQNDGHLADRLVTVETRIGTDLSTGVMWPLPPDPQNYVFPAWVVPNDPRWETAPVWPFPIDPQNRSATYAYFYADPERVPFSERYQFLGDPRHSPYADTDATGTSFPHGYNWYFDDLWVEGFDGVSQPADHWSAFDRSRLADGWAEQVDFDAPRMFEWLRTGVARTGFIFAHLAGPSFTHISLGGDVASLEDGDIKGVPVYGGLYNSDGIQLANTLGEEGSGEAKGSRSYVCSNAEVEGGLRDGGTWWAKPWIGELFPDREYFEQWSWFGNLFTANGNNSSEDRFHHMRRDKAPEDQLPYGMKRLETARCEVGALGVTSFFNTGSELGTIRQEDHRGTSILVDDGLDVLLDDGEDVGQEYGFALPKFFRMDFPFGLNWAEGDKTNGFENPPEWSFAETAPRWTISRAARYLADRKHPEGETGSATLRITDPTGLHHGRVILGGIARDVTGGDTLLARYAILTLLNSLGKEGLPATPERIQQVPRILFNSPLPGAVLADPVSVTVRWHLEWRRWDGRKYNDYFEDGFEEDESDLVYVVMESDDYGETWRNAMDKSWAFEGELPLRADGTPDPARTIRDMEQGGELSWTLALPTETYPAGTYIVRVEVHRLGHPLHYAYKTERIDVER